MGMLFEGAWREEDVRIQSADGQFQRPETQFRDFVSTAPGARFAPARGRYHLIVADACPWCHRTILLRALKKLEDVVSIARVEPLMLQGGWHFAAPDPVTGASYVHEVYSAAVPRYTGRASVPVLWDRERQTIVSNESEDIVRMFNAAFDGLAGEHTDFYPAALRAEIDLVNARVYETLNNGVYRCGFARSQEAHRRAVLELFDTLDWLEARLRRQPYVAGARLTEADWRLFPTLVRFDAVYYGLFKCNLRHVYEYPALWDYTKRLYCVPGVAATVDIENYKTHYYGSLRMINPTGIVPIGPRLDFGAPPEAARAVAE